MELEQLKKIADQYTPAQGYLYAVLLDYKGETLSELNQEATFCCGSKKCKKQALKRLKKEHLGQKYSNWHYKVMTVRAVEFRNDDSADHFPICPECEKIIETGLDFQESEVEELLQLDSADFSNPYYAYRVWRMLDEWHMFNCSELVDTLLQRVLSVEYANPNQTNLFK